MASRLGSQLAKFRSDFNFTQKEAAAVLGCGASTIGHIENGRNEPRATTAAGIRTAMKAYRESNVTATVQPAQPAFEEPINYNDAMALRFCSRIANNDAISEELRAEARLVASFITGD